MRWVCPGCGSQVSVALRQCPNCGSSEESTPSAPVSSANSTTAAPTEKPSPAAATKAPTQRLLPTPRPVVQAAPERENPIWRGVKFGVGFMMAVAMILLLLAMLLLWLRHQGWQPWLDSAAP